MKNFLESMLASEIQAEEISPQSYYENSNGENINGDDDDDDDDWDEVWAAIQKERNKPFNASQSEELHKQVFENEQGYLEQSETFRKSLTNPDEAEKATMQRRSARYRQRQSKAIEKLNQQLEDFEHVWAQKERPKPAKCSRCACKLSDDDFDIVPQFWMRKQNFTNLCESCYKVLIDMSRNIDKTKPQSETQAPESRSTMASSSTRTSSRPNPRDSRTAFRTGNTKDFSFQRQRNIPDARAQNGRVAGSSRPDRPSPPGGPYQDSDTTSKSQQNWASSPSTASPRDELEEDNESDSWEQMVDPDTGEIFYLNPETGEFSYDS
jgi:hypothetical protein